MGSAIYSAANATSTGADAVVTVPAGQRWKVKAIAVDMQASGATGQRQMSVVAVVNSYGVADIIAAYQQNPGEHIYFYFAQGLIDSGLIQNDDVRTGFPEVVLGPGDTIRTGVGNLQSGDAINLNVNYEATLL